MISILVAIVLPIAVTAFAQVAPNEQNSLIQLRSRTFDLGHDVRFMRQYEGFIPITRVPWIYAMIDGDPLLDATVIHIRSVAHLLGEPVWLPDLDREQFAPAGDLTDVWALEDFDVRWRHKVAPPTRGDIILFPKAPDAGYFVSCAYERVDAVPTFCAANALYPPDPDLRIKVRIYRVMDPLNDFTAITKRALNLVYCLDVTKALEADSWRPMEGDKPQSLSEFLSTCKNISS